jgi:hypothetical protein
MRNKYTGNCIVKPQSAYGKIFWDEIVCHNKINDSKTFLQNIYRELTVNFSRLKLQILLAEYMKLL